MFSIVLSTSEAVAIHQLFCKLLVNVLRCHGPLIYAIVQLFRNDSQPTLYGQNLTTPLFAMHSIFTQSRQILVVVLPLARFYGHALGVDLLGKSIQTDSLFRNVLLDQEQ